MKIFIKIVLLLAVVVYLAYALLNLTHSDPNAVCRGLELRIDGRSPRRLDPSATMLDSVAVLDILAKHKIHPAGTRIDKLNLAYIDSIIESDPCVIEAMCYKNASNFLCIDIKTLHPVVRVMGAEGGYYLDANGMSMPFDDRYIDVPLATGHINRKWAADHLVQLVSHMDNEYWRDRIEQICVSSDSTVTLVPREGDHLIHLGQVENVGDKLMRLRQFYKQGLDKVGWNKYSDINLEYDNQIICTKKK